MSVERITYLETKRANLALDSDAIVARATDEDRLLTDVESTQVDEITRQADLIDAEHAKLVGAVIRQQAAQELAAKVPTVDTLRTQVHASGKDENEYPGNFILDVIRARLNFDPSAARRIAESNERETDGVLRAWTSGDLGGAVIPKYETPVVIPLESGRNFLNSLQRRDLTSEVVHIPTFDNDSHEPGFQTSQNTTFTAVDFGTTDATYTSRTIGVYTDISRQALDFNSSISTTDVLNTLQRAYNVLVEREALAGTTDSTSHLLGLLSTPGVYGVDGSTWTTGDQIYTGLGKALEGIDDSSLSDSQPHVVMARTQWNALKFALSTSHPLLAATAGPIHDSLQVGSASTYSIGEYIVHVSNNVRPIAATPPNGSMVVYRPEDIYFYEANGGRLSTITDVQTIANSGGVRLVGSNYVNFPGCRPRPGNVAIITGLRVV